MMPIVAGDHITPVLADGPNIGGTVWTTGTAGDIITATLHQSETLNGQGGD